MKKYAILIFIIIVIVAGISYMYLNYKAHGWNGDMDARLEKVYAMRTDS